MATQPAKDDQGGGGVGSGVWGERGAQPGACYELQGSDPVHLSFSKYGLGDLPSSHTLPRTGSTPPTHHRWFTHDTSPPTRHYWLTCNTPGSSDAQQVLLVRGRPQPVLSGTWALLGAGGTWDLNHTGSWPVVQAVPGRCGRALQAPGGPPLPSCHPSWESPGQGGLKACPTCAQGSVCLPSAGLCSLPACFPSSSRALPQHPPEPLPFLAPARTGIPEVAFTSPAPCLVDHHSCLLLLCPLPPAWETWEDPQGGSGMCDASGRPTSFLAGSTLHREPAAMLLSSCPCGAAGRDA
ncbi:uncharacterized protein LOC129017630 [Pongo pygmaeus]|uniref:uncharacterized protein LOC129017630 n=1 Tax=Pongo pygmaeus TaxID=9600 RepID=UPI0023E09065|nr:uncharacterized protein LOC129017630 [Pongo pygmaeus]